MRKIIKSLLYIACLICASCSTGYNSLTIVDKNIDPIGSTNQLVLAPDRGEVGHYVFPLNGRSEEAIIQYKLSGSGSKSWLLENWGNPDRSYSKTGIEFFVYEKKSRNAPNYSMQFLGGENPVTIGFQGGKMVSISIYAKNCPAYMKGPVHVLPK